MHCILYTALYSIHCNICTVCCSLLYVQCTLYTALHCTVHSTPLTSTLKGGGDCFGCNTCLQIKIRPTPNILVFFCCFKQLRKFEVSYFFSTKPNVSQVGKKISQLYIFCLSDQKVCNFLLFLKKAFKKINSEVNNMTL